MTKLLSIEWLKVKKYRTFWILILFFVGLMPIWNYAIVSGAIKFGGGDANFFSRAYSFGTVWSNLGFWASIFVVFLSILTIILTTNENTFRTNRQNVIDGLGKMGFFHAKWLMVVVFTLFTGLFVFLLGLVFGASNGDVADFPGDIHNFFYLLLLAFNYYSFALLLAFLFKRSGIAIGMFILYSLILEAMLKGLINWLGDTTLGNYLPLQASDELLPFPIMKMLQNLTGGETEIVVAPYIVASLAWIVIYYIIGRMKLQRSDW